jgi:hypothetical protein
VDVILLRDNVPGTSSDVLFLQNINLITNGLGTVKFISAQVITSMPNEWGATNTGATDIFP